MRRVALGWLVLGVLCARGAPGDELGRLFFTPEERATMEAARALPKLAPLVSVSALKISNLPGAIQAVVTPPPPVLTLNGLVTRSQGPATLWINGLAQDARSLYLPGVAQPRVRLERNAIQIALDATQPARRVKAGQTFDPASAQVSDVHQTPNTETP